MSLSGVIEELERLRGHVDALIEAGADLAQEVADRAGELDADGADLTIAVMTQRDRLNALVESWEDAYARYESRSASADMREAGEQLAWLVEHVVQLLTPTEGAPPPSSVLASEAAAGRPWLDDLRLAIAAWSQCTEVKVANHG